MKPEHLETFTEMCDTTTKLLANGRTSMEVFQHMSDQYESETVDAWMDAIGWERKTILMSLPTETSKISSRNERQGRGHHCLNH